MTHTRTVDGHRRCAPCPQRGFLERTRQQILGLEGLDHLDVALLGGLLCVGGAVARGDEVQTVRDASVQDQLHDPVDHAHRHHRSLEMIASSELGNARIDRVAGHHGGSALRPGIGGHHQHVVGQHHLRFTLRNLEVGQNGRGVQIDAAQTIVDDAVHEPTVGLGDVALVDARFLGVGARCTRPVGVTARRLVGGRGFGGRRCVLHPATIPTPIHRIHVESVGRDPLEHLGLGPLDDTVTVVESRIQPDGVVRVRVERTHRGRRLTVSGT